jgi:hypothetical protein
LDLGDGTTLEEDDFAVSAALGAVVVVAGPADLSGPKLMPYGPGYDATFFTDPFGQSA